jgi:hypothetical protein
VIKAVAAAMAAAAAVRLFQFMVMFPICGSGSGSAGSGEVLRCVFVLECRDQVREIAVAVGLFVGEIL